MSAKRRKAAYRPGWHNVREFDARMPIDGRLSVWVRRDGVAFTLGPGSGHVDQAIQISGIMDDDAAFNALFNAGELRAFLSVTKNSGDVGASFTGTPTPAQVRTMNDMLRANSVATFHWAKYDESDNRLAMGHDWKSFVALVNAPRENPPRLWRR